MSFITFSSTIGNDNTAYGVLAGSSLTTGSSNLLIGKNAGRDITTGSSNTILGGFTGFASIAGYQLDIRTSSSNTVISLPNGDPVITANPGRRVMIGNTQYDSASFPFNHSGEFLRVTGDSSTSATIAIHQTSNANFNAAFFDFWRTTTFTNSNQSVGNIRFNRVLTNSSGQTAASIFCYGSNDSASSQGILRFDARNQLEHYILGAEASRVDSSRNTIQILQSAAPALTINGQLVLNLTSDTNLRISVRGSDGVTRVANITLA